MGMQTGYKLTEEHKEKISKANKGRTPWNKGLQVSWNKGIKPYKRSKRIVVNGESVYQHRHIYALEHGKIPDGIIIHHINCDNTDNNIDNLKAMTQSEHVSLHHKLLKEERGMI